MYQAYLQTKFLEYIEMRSYAIATRNSDSGRTIKRRKSKKIAIPELFDMIAGSETGAIIASYLSIAIDYKKNEDIQPNKFWAADVSKIFNDHTDLLWFDKQIPLTTRIIIMVLITGFGVWIVKISSQKRFDTKEMEEALHHLKKYHQKKIKD